MSESSATVPAQPVPPKPSSYELPLPGENIGASAARSPGGNGALPGWLLVDNALWFCQLRWVVAGILASFGLLELLFRVAMESSLHIRPDWPLGTAGLLVAINAVFHAHARALKRSENTQRAVNVSLWGQIVLDLLVLTVVVHFVGSTETYVPFAYLFHIVLACIFFPRRQSLMVMLLATVLYTGCVFGELAGVIPHSSVLPETFRLADTSWSSHLAVVHLLTAVTIWLAVWYLAARLSQMVRQRDSDLADANARLLAAQSERARHMLTTTHQLKAPFAAIHANAQLLLRGRCGKLPDEAVAVVQRISARCARLTGEIQDMLQLANLSSTGQPHPIPQDVDLADLLRDCVRQAEGVARQRAITIRSDLQPAVVVGVEDHLRMLFQNLLSNAVAYCYSGGKVQVTCAPTAGGLMVTIGDDGIGVPAEKLPRIFEEYYRTNEAIRHNKASSGLGLAIVREVANRHGIKLRVESTLGAGTTFKLRFASGVRVPRERWGEEV